MTDVVLQLQAVKTARHERMAASGMCLDRAARAAKRTSDTFSNQHKSGVFVKG
jgi:hypothetical protein